MVIPLRFSSVFPCSFRKFSASFEIKASLSDGKNSSGMVIYFRLLISFFKVELALRSRSQKRESTESCSFVLCLIVAAVIKITITKKIVKTGIISQWILSLIFTNSITHFRIEVNSMYNFNNKNNQKVVVAIAIILVVAMIVTTFVSVLV